MNKAGKIAVVLVLIAAVGITVALKQSRLSSSQEQASAAVSEVEVSGLQAEVPKEQTQDNTQASAAMPRLVDLGADKYTQQRRYEQERNPMLGLRSLRYSLQNLEMFKVQLRAILRASVQGNVRLMFPVAEAMPYHDFLA